jgi:predicted TIM-barrel fold metal-dependent hydrolase
MRVDVHCHIGQRRRLCGDDGRFSFEAPGKHASCDSYFSDVLYDGAFMRLARWHFGLGGSRSSEEEFDATVERILLDHILNAKSIDRVILLAFDQYHTDDGQSLGSRRHLRQHGSDLYVSNTYARQLWLRHPRRILFGASIHPYRRDGRKTAVDMLQEVAAAGAVLVKWLPLSQNIDGQDPRTIEFLRCAASLGIPLLIHCGCEAALGNMHPRFKDPAPWLRTLRQLRQERCTPTVIIAHVASPPLWPVTSARTLHILLEALTGEFADAPLYADLAGMTMVNKAVWLKKLAQMPDIHHKLVHGSDFPIPPFPIVFWPQLRHRYKVIRELESWLDQDIAVKTALGFPESVFERAGELLAGRIRLADRLAGLV